MVSGGGCGYGGGSIVKIFALGLSSPNPCFALYYLAAMAEEEETAEGNSNLPSLPTRFQISKNKEITKKDSEVFDLRLCSVIRKDHILLRRQS